MTSTLPNHEGALLFPDEAVMLSYLAMICQLLDVDHHLLQVVIFVIFIAGK